MKESYGEGVATHTDPETCAGARKGAGEALTGARAGRVSSREIHAPSRKRRPLRGADAMEGGGRRHPTRRHRETRRGPGRSGVGVGRCTPQAASGSPRTYADDGRTREVGQARSTWEAAEQSPGTGGGGGGGKGSGQGELARAQRTPDTGPGRCAQRARAGTSGSKKAQETAGHRAPAPRVRHRSSPHGG